MQLSGFLTFVFVQSQTFRETDQRPSCSLPGGVCLASFCQTSSSVLQEGACSFVRFCLLPVLNSAVIDRHTCITFIRTQTSVACSCTSCLLLCSTSFFCLFCVFRPEPILGWPFPAPSAPANGERWVPHLEASCLESASGHQKRLRKARFCLWEFTRNITETVMTAAPQMSAPRPHVKTPQRPKGHTDCSKISFLVMFLFGLFK